jgi:RimJ/RimL family protein N-acetyltransferase
MFLKTIELENGKELRIREALPNDAASLIAFVKQVMDETANLSRPGSEFDMTIEDEIKYIESCLTSNHKTNLLGFVDDVIVTSLSLNGHSASRLRHVSTVGMSVKKSHWGLGIGTVMLDSAIEYAKDKGVTKINLEVRTDNERAFHLYKKVGFEVEGTNRHAMLVNDVYVDTYYMGIFI